MREATVPLDWPWPRARALIPPLRPATAIVPALPNPLDPPSTLLVRTPSDPRQETGVGSRAVRPDKLERRLQERLDALGPTPRAELLHVLMLPDFEEADRIGEFWGNRRRAPSRSF